MDFCKFKKYPPPKGCKLIETGDTKDCKVGKNNLILEMVERIRGNFPGAGHNLHGCILIVNSHSLVPTM